MRDGETPRICYTDPSGTLRGPFDDWRILEWYRQGFFANTILFKLENSDAQFSLGELIERFGRENPFANRLNWENNRNNLNGVASSSETTPKQDININGGCSECRRNGEKLDALLVAVHRLQTALDANTQNVADNTTAISGLQTMFEESRLSAWKWNAGDIGGQSEQKLPSLPSFNNILQKSEETSTLAKKETPSKNEEICSKDASKKQNGSGDVISKVKDDALDTKWNLQDLVKDVQTGDDSTFSLEKPTGKSIQLDNLVSAELMKMQTTSNSPKKQDKQESILERIKKKSNGVTEKNGQSFIPSNKMACGYGSDDGGQSFVPSNKMGFGYVPDDVHRQKSQQHENDWINANTRPSFHPFPEATTPSMSQQMPQQSNGVPSWPGLNTNIGQPHPMTFHQGRAVPGHTRWGQNNPFSALQVAYQNPSTPPSHPPTFAAAALKERKEVQQQKKTETEEIGPRLVPVGRNPPRMIMRRAPTNK